MQARSPRSIARFGPVATALASAVLVALSLASPPPSDGGAGQTLRVPADYPTIEAAIAASSAGDVILLAPGTYLGDVGVPPEKAGITIRGEDRNTVIFDGGDIRKNAIDVEADGVTLENMTAHNFTENGFYWDGVENYAGRYLTVWNVGLYAIYAISSRGGVIEHSYASGAADAAFYIGECNPCDAVVRNVTATLSAVGYSGTNAGGNLVLEDSRFENNSIGILPNSFEVGLEPPPQREAIFRRNVVIGSGSVPVPRTTPLGGFHGVGIGVAGGVANVIEDNEVTDSSRYGIAVFTAIDFQAQWVPADNHVSTNRVSGSGIADLALAAGAGANNCFTDNEAAVALPADVAAACSQAGDGDASVAGHLVIPPPQLLEGLPPAPGYATMPAPAAQPTMPDTGGPGAAPGTATDSSIVVAIGASLAVAAIMLVGTLVVLRRRR